MKSSMMVGLIAWPSFFVVRCRCGPVDAPVLPEIAMFVPALTNSFSFTSCCERWQ